MPFDHFNLIAGLYARIAKFRIRAPLLELLALPCEGRLLDAGGGTGRVAEALRGMVRKTVVADLSRGMLHHAAKKDLATVCAETEQLPFAVGAFDRIIMVDSLHHVRNQRQTIKELWRVIAHGGKMVIIEPDINKLAVKLLAFGEKMLFMRSHFLSAETIASLFPDQQTDVKVIHDEYNVWVYAEKVREM